MFNSLFGKALLTFFISMIPVIELRGAIPIGVANGLPVHLACIVSIIGNMLPIPFVILFIRKIFDWLRSKSEWLDDKITKFEVHTLKKADRVRRASFFGLLLFVAIPFPGTGAWTGALIAALLEIRLKIAIPAIFLGVIIAAVIVSLATGGVITFIHL